MSDFSHLLPEVAGIMDRPTSDRIAFANKEVWIGYPRAHRVLDALEDLVNMPKTLRMPNILLVGDSGNGKSTIVKSFRERHEAYVEQGGTPVVPVLVAEMPSEPSESRFWSSILDSLMVAHRPADNVQRKEAQAMSILRCCETKVLIVDEIHNLLFGHARQQRQFLGVLKNLSNRLQIPIVAVGTRDAIRAIHTDTQLSSRFEPVALPRWELNREYLMLLASFERLMPLAELSSLGSKELAIRIFSMSGGTIGGTAGVIKKATIHAIRSGKEKIDIDCLKSIEWVKLADYGKAADRL